MYRYILSRFLLMIPTLIGVLTIFFFITEFVPGGPYDQIIAKIRGTDQMGGGEIARVSREDAEQRKIDPRDAHKIKRQYELNKNCFKRYLRSLLFFEHDSITSSVEIYNTDAERVRVGRTSYFVVRNDKDAQGNYAPIGSADSTPAFDVFANNYVIDEGAQELFAFDPVDKVLYETVNYTALPDKVVQTQAGFERHNGVKTFPLKVIDLAYDKDSKRVVAATVGVAFFFDLNGKPLDNAGARSIKKIETYTRYEEIMDIDINKDGLEERKMLGRHELYVKQDWKTAIGDWNNYHGYFLLKFPDSLRYGKPAYDVIMERMPVSVRLGVISFFLVYSICIVLGIAKAVRDGSAFDAVTSMIILIGYSIPGFVLAMFLLKCIGPVDPLIAELIPLGDLHTIGEAYDNMSAWGKFWDNVHHLIGPIICYTIGSFAMFTMLTKNSILEHTQKLYAVAARARGLSERKVLFKHILRNSLIPLITGFPTAFLMMFFGGSLLIEKIFNLEGIGQLGYTAITASDFPLLMSDLFIFTLIGLIGRLLTDIAYVVVDPRISFERSNA